MHLITITSSFPASKSDYSGIFVAEPLRFFDLEKDVIALSFHRENKKEAINGAYIHWIRWNFIVEKVLAKSSVEGGLPTLLKRYPWLFLFLPMMIWKIFKKTKTLLKKQSIIHVHWLPNALPAVIISKIYGTPFIVTVRGSEQIYMNSRLFRSIVKNIINSSEYIVSVSARLKNKMITKYRGTNILYIPNGVNDFSVVNEEVFNDNELKMIFVGNLTLNKAVHILLRSLMNLDIKVAFNLIIVGEGPERNNLELLTRSYGLKEKVEFKGNVDHQKVFRLIQKNSVFILPSFSEGTPNVIKEAMVCARPVIATNVGGTPELIEHGVNGLLFNPGDHNTLCDHITYIAENREIAREMGLKGRQFIIDQNLTWENTAKQYLKVYRNVLARKN